MDSAVAGRAAGLLRALGTGAVAVAAGLLPALSADLQDPLSSLTPVKGSMLCFGRDYSPDHLAQHPKQTTKAVRLAFEFFQEQDPQRHVTIVLTPRAGAPRQITAYCLWWQGAGIDTSGRKTFPTFDKSAAFNCVVTVRNTDKESGALLIDPAQDAKTLTLFLESPIAAADSKPGDAEPYFLALEPEDRIFALARIEPSACASFTR